MKGVVNQWLMKKSWMCTVPRMAHGCIGTVWGDYQMNNQWSLLSSNGVMLIFGPKLMCPFNVTRLTVCVCVCVCIKPALKVSINIHLIEDTRDFLDVRQCMTTHSQKADFRLSLQRSHYWKLIWNTKSDIIVCWFINLLVRTFAHDYQNLTGASY